jgi:methylphosphotriester-DNA--protein-cysteine methyltransferase
MLECAPELAASLCKTAAQFASDVPVSTVAVAVAVAVTVEPDYQGSSAFISMVRKTLGDTPQRYLRREGGAGSVSGRGWSHA